MVEVQLLDVLIPILMDYPLGVFCQPHQKGKERIVLIPILMDYPLGAPDLDRVVIKADES